MLFGAAKQNTHARSLGFTGSPVVRTPRFHCMGCRWKWQPTPVFLPGKSHARRSLAGYSPQGRKELDTTVQLTHTYTQGTKGLPRWCSGKESTYQEENAGSVPGLGRSPGMASHSSTPVWEIP